MHISFLLIPRLGFLGNDIVSNANTCDSMVVALVLDTATIPTLAAALAVLVAATTTAEALEALDMPADVMIMVEALAVAVAMAALEATLMAHLAGPLVAHLEGALVAPPVGVTPTEALGFHQATMVAEVAAAMADPVAGAIPTVGLEAHPDTAEGRLAMAAVTLMGRLEQEAQGTVVLAAVTTLMARLVVLEDRAVPTLVALRMALDPRLALGMTYPLLTDDLKVLIRLQLR